MIPRVFKWGTLLGLGVIVTISIYGMYLYSQIREYAVRDEAQAADAIVVLGAAQYNGRPSPVLKARLDHAYDLYKAEYAHAIITTGSYGPDPNFSEAQVSTKYLVQHGVEVANIVTEQGSAAGNRQIASVISYPAGKSKATPDRLAVGAARGDLDDPARGAVEVYQVADLDVAHGDLRVLVPKAEHVQRQQMP